MSEIKYTCDCGVLGEREFDISYSMDPYVPAKTWGPMDSCYPAEGGEIDIFDICLDGTSVFVLFYDALSQDEDLAQAIIDQEDTSGDDDRADHYRDYERDERSERDRNAEMGL